MKPFAPGRLALTDLAIGAVVATLTAAQGILTVAMSSELWVGAWPNSSAIIDLATLWGACITAAVAAWVTATPRRHKYLQVIRASSRSQIRIYISGLLSVGIGNLAGYLAVLGYVVSVTGPIATHGRLDLIELLTPLAAVPMALGFGTAAGRILPARLAPIVAAITPYVLYFLSAYAEVYTHQAAFSDVLTDDQIDRSYVRLPAELLTSRAVFWAAIGIALLSWVLLANRVAYTATVVAGFAASFVLLTAGTRTDVPSQYAIVCLDGAPRICVDRAHDHLLAEYHDRIDADLALIPGLDLSAFTVVPYPELFPFAQKYTGAAPPPGPQITVSLINDNTTLAHEIDPVGLDANVGFGLFLAPCLLIPAGSDRPPGTEAGRRSATVLDDWWLTFKHLPANGGNFMGEPNVEAILADDPELLDAAKRLAAMSDASRAAWFAMNQDAILSCRAALP